MAEPVRYGANERNTKTVVDEKTVNFGNMSAKDKQEFGSVSKGEYANMLNRLGDTGDSEVKRVVEKAQREDIGRGKMVRFTGINFFNQ